MGWGRRSWRSFFSSRRDVKGGKVERWRVLFMTTSLGAEVHHVGIQIHKAYKNIQTFIIENIYEYTLRVT